MRCLFGSAATALNVAFPPGQSVDGAGGSEWTLTRQLIHAHLLRIHRKVWPRVGGQTLLEPSGPKGGAGGGAEEEDEAGAGCGRVPGLGVGGFVPVALQAVPEGLPQYTCMMKLWRGASASRSRSHPAQPLSVASGRLPAPEDEGAADIH